MMLDSDPSLLFLAMLHDFITCHYKTLYLTSLIYLLYIIRTFQLNCSNSTMNFKNNNKDNKSLV